jgi:hypothetical protein
MPVNYQFVNDQGVAEDLATIDNELCRQFCLEPDPDRYSNLYEILTMLGLFCTKRGEFNLDDWEWVIEYMEIPAQHARIYKDFIFGKYRFDSWGNS